MSLGQQERAIAAGNLDVSRLSACISPNILALELGPLPLTAEREVYAVLINEIPLSGRIYTASSRLSRFTACPIRAPASHIAPLDFPLQVPPLRLC